MLATTGTMKDENSAPTADGELVNGERERSYASCASTASPAAVVFRAVRSFRVMASSPWVRLWWMAIWWGGEARLWEARRLPPPHQMASACLPAADSSP